MQRLFAHAIASLVSLAIVQHQLLLIEAELHDANCLQRALFAGARDAILISDASTGHILDANPQAEKLFGRQRHQLLGVLQNELHSPDDGLDIDRLLELARPDGTETLRSTVVSQDGKAIPVEIVGYEVQLARGEKIVQGFFRPRVVDFPAP